jgi:hypothetical protein
MIYAQNTKLKRLRWNVTFVNRRLLILSREIRGTARGAIFPFVPLTLILLFASPAYSQLAPETSAVGAASDSSSIVVSHHIDFEKEPGNAQPSPPWTHISHTVLGEAQASKDAHNPLEENVEGLRRELATARAELAKQAQALKAQQQTDEALSHSLETAQRVIENLRAAATLSESSDNSVPGANPSMEASEAPAKQALEDERQKVELLKQQLSTAYQTIDALKTGANLAAVEQASTAKDRQVAEAASKQAGEALKLERERADSATSELDSVRKERDALRQQSTVLSAALDQERERSNGLARSLSAARETIDIFKDKRRITALQRATKVRAPAGELALPRSGATRKPPSQEKQKEKGEDPSQSEVLATIDLPAALLPTRPPKKRGLRQ